MDNVCRAKCNISIPFDFENCALTNDDLENKLPKQHTTKSNITGLQQLNTEPTPKNWAQRNIQYIETQTNKFDDDYNERANQSVQDHESENIFVL